MCAAAAAKILRVRGRGVAEREWLSTGQNVMRVAG